MKSLIIAIIIFAGVNVGAESFDYNKFSRHLRSYEYQQAERMLQSMDKSTDMFVRNKGIFFHAKFEADSAIFYLKKAFDNDIRDDEVLIKFAEALMWMKNFRDGSMILGMVDNENSIDYKKAKAVYYELQSDFDKAVKLYSEVIKAEELPYGTMERKANVLSWMNKFDEANALFDKIISTDVVSQPLKLRAMVSKARVLSWQKDFNQALATLEDVIKKDSKNVDARLVKGQIYQWQGEYKKAKDIYSDIVQINPNNREAKLQLEDLMWVK